MMDTLGNIQRQRGANGQHYSTTGMQIKPPRHIVWSTDTVDLSDPI